MAKSNRSSSSTIARPGVPGDSRSWTWRPAKHKTRFNRRTVSRWVDVRCALMKPRNGHLDPSPQAVVVAAAAAVHAAGSRPSRVGLESASGGPLRGYSRLHSPHFLELVDHVDGCRFSLPQALRAAHVAQRDSLAAIQHLVGHEPALGAVDVRIAVLGLLRDRILERRAKMQFEI